MRTLGEEEEEEEKDDDLIDENEMVDEEEVENLENDEVLEALAVGMVSYSGTRVPVPQICTCHRDTAAFCTEGGADSSTAKAKPAGCAG